MCTTNINPIEIEDVDEENVKLAKRVYRQFSLVRVGPKRWCLPKNYEFEGPIYRNFEPRTDDVWMFGCPRSGTTVMQEIVWLIGNDLNYEKAAGTVMDLRFSFFEHNLFPYQDEMKKFLNNGDEKAELARKMLTPAWQRLESTKERRFIKTHLPFSLMPKILTSGCKIIYVCRNPRDVIVSYCILTAHLEHIEPNIEDFWSIFRHDLVVNTPYFEHLKEGWAIRNEPNVLFIIYDEFMTDIRTSLARVADFLGKQLSNDDLDRLEEHLNIDNFRKNQSVNCEHLREFGVMSNVENGFIRRGKRGGWRDYFTGTMEVDVNRWIEENLKDCELYEYFK